MDAAKEGRSSDVTALVGKGADIECKGEVRHISLNLFALCVVVRARVLYMHFNVYELMYADMKFGFCAKSSLLTGSCLCDDGAVSFPNTARAHGAPLGCQRGSR